MSKSAWLMLASVNDVMAWPREICVERWEALFGQEPPSRTTVVFMRKALAYEVQVAQQGGLSRTVQKALKGALKGSQKTAELTDTAAVSSSGSDASRTSSLASGPTVLRSGTHLIREWNGRRYQVEVVDDGFRLDGRSYRSLTAVAKVITGVHWSGPRFFGLR